jgi:hypothetical protein
MIQPISAVIAGGERPSFDAGISTAVRMTSVAPNACDAAVVDRDENPARGGAQTTDRLSFDGR